MVRARGEPPVRTCNSQRKYPAIPSQLSSAEVIEDYSLDSSRFGEVETELLRTYNPCRSGIGSEIEDIGITQAFQSRLGYPAAHSTLAMQQQQLILVLYAAWQEYFNLVQRKV